MPILDRHATMRKLCTVLCFAGFLSAALVPGGAESDTLTPGQSLRGNDTLISKGQSFTLGFFTGKSKDLYLGIWYNQIPEKTKVWVANRRRPIPAGTSNSSLTMSQNGSLVLEDAAGTIYWSTVLALGSPVARLLNDGNLVVVDQRSNSYAWQSFDHPADTLLPGMKIGFNRRTGDVRNLTAWRSADDPSPGKFSVGLDARGVPQLFIMNGSAPLWRGGPWIRDRFTGIPAMRSSSTFLYGFNPGPDEIFFTYAVFDKSLLNRIVMNTSGVAQHLEWHVNSSSWVVVWSSVEDTCDRLDACGPNSLCNATTTPVCGCPERFEPKKQQEWQRGVTAAGCVRTKPLQCQNGRDTFVLVAGAKLPESSKAKTASVGSEECRARCLSDCTCTAFSSSDSSGCINWFSDLADLRVYGSAGQDLYVRVAGDDQGGKDQKKVIIIIVMLVIFFMIILSMLICLCMKRRKSKGRLEEMQHTMEEHINDECDGGSDFEVPLFQFSTLEFATDKFSFQNKLGKGGYGPVYKGKMQDGQCVAIKRLSKESTQGLEQFKSEVQLVAKLQHTNLVRLLGCCIEKGEKILVYEYMPNQSLEKFIFDADRGSELDWSKRLHIIDGITQGLLYLHKYSRLRVIHRDLKASNILLDEEWNAKIADFGLARIFSWSEPQANTKRIIGTYGYMSPEYAMKGLFSIKSDVFSFGVLLLEILTGKRSTSIYHFGISRNLPGHAWELWREGRELVLIDPSLGNLVPRNEFSRYIQVALLCVQDNPMDRPTMLDIVSMLNNDSTSLPTPNQPGFFLAGHTIEEENNHDIQHFSSSNSVTFSGIEGR